MARLFTAILLLTLACTSCTWLERIFSKPDKAQSGLTVEQAKRRTSLISDVKYNLSFELEKDDKTFSGITGIQFTLNRKVDRLRVDFQGGKVQSVKLNGSPVKVNYNDYFINVESENFKSGPNSITISYDMRYSTFGAGLYKFTDPADGESYIYSDFEPYDANRLFPCFDQPDLKATYKTRVKAPKGWQVVTSVRETQIEDQGKTRYWTFPESQKFSTYIYSLHAGPYSVFEDPNFRYPLRLMVRKSMQNYVEKDHWFKVTRQGFDYFDEYFGYKYPFVKYDQVIVPDFNSGAMENVAAVTFSERYLRKGEYTNDDRRAIASVVLHEMAHMWFGNLVTMQWWNDLWLNESFASIMAAKSLYEATEFKTSWRSFFARLKQWAYWEDQLETTHPIETEVRTTDDAFANFDGITYGKGASTLKQIIHYLGNEGFKKGLQHYFETYAYKNTELKDFIASLEYGSGEDLAWWSKQWLQTTGVNTITVDLQCKESKVEKAILVQSSKLKTPGLRRHKTKLAAIYDENETLKVKQVIDLTYEMKNTTIKDLIGKKCPDAIYPNYEDHDYVKVKLDSRSLKTLQKKLSTIDDPLLRLMIWRNQWDMVRDQSLAVQEYIDLVINNLDKIEEKDILKSVLSTVSSTRGGYSPSFSYLPDEPESIKKFRFEKRKILESMLWKELNSSKEDVDRHLTWFNHFASFVREKEGLSHLKNIYESPTEYSLLHKDQDLRWRMLYMISTYGAINVDSFVNEELKRDKSDSAENWKLAIAAAKPDLKTKELFYKRLTKEKSEDSARKQKVIARNLFPDGQEELRLKFAERYYKDLKAFNNSRNDIFLEAFAEELAPISCNAATQKEVKKFVENTNLKENVSRGLRKILEEDRRCIAVKQFAVKSQKTTRM